MKLLVILPRFPYPLEKGDKLRAFYQIQELAKYNDICLFALSDIDVKQEWIVELRPYCKEIHIHKQKKSEIIFNFAKAFLKGQPLQIGYYYCKTAQKKLDKIYNNFSPDHIYCQLVRTAEYIKDYNTPKTLDYQDAFSKGIERRIKTEKFFLAPVFKMEYKRLLKYEARAFDMFDIKTIISHQDRDLIDHPSKEKIHIVPNGVDFDFYKPMEAGKKNDLLFIGNMNYSPNVTASEYVVNKIMPLLSAKFPNLNFLIAGANPKKAVLDLKSDQVEVSGWIDDVREAYASSRIFLAPMQIGIGLQNKLLQAMAMKIPCICSELANNALNAESGKEIFVGKEPEEYAEFVETLLNDEKKCEEIAENAYNFVHKNYDWSSICKKLNDMMKSV